jgi:hypothetical protein
MTIDPFEVIIWHDPVLPTGFDLRRKNRAARITRHQKYGKKS